MTLGPGLSAAVAFAAVALAVAAPPAYVPATVSAVGAGTLSIGPAPAAIVFAGENSGALAHLGSAAWKSVVPAPFTGDTTTFLELEAAGGLESQVYMGLGDGSLFVLAAANGTRWSEADAFARGLSLPVRWAGVPGSGTALDLQASAVAAGSLDFVRVEGGAFDTRTPGIFYFVTSGRGAAVNPYGRLYGLSFDPTDPSAPGTLTLLLDGSEGVVSPYSVAINGHGELAICERPNFRLSTIGLARDPSVWIYEIGTNALHRVAEIEAAAGGPEFAGVIDAESRLGRGSWLLDVRSPQGNQRLQLVWRSLDMD